MFTPQVNLTLAFDSAPIDERLCQIREAMALKNFNTARLLLDTLQDELPGFVERAITVKGQ